MSLRPLGLALCIAALSACASGFVVVEAQPASGMIMAAMPVLVWLAFDAMRPDLTRPMMQHWFGYAMVTVVVIMELLGWLFIRRIVAIKI